MQIFENQTFEGFRDRKSGATFCHLEFHKCHFEDCLVSITDDPALRSTIRNVKLINCSSASSLGPAIVEDVLVDGLKTVGLFQIFGAVFNRVVLRGEIDRLMISNEPLPDLFVNHPYQYENVEAFKTANAEFYRHVEWALDISEGEFKELDIRGVPTHLIRRDPESQVIVTREKAIEGRWKVLPLRETLWPTWIQHFLEAGEESTILPSPKRHPKFKDYLADLRLLQKAGVAELD